MSTEAKRRIAFGSLSAVAVALLPTHVVAETAYERAMKTCNAAMVQVLDTPRPDLSVLQPSSSADEPYRLEIANTRGEWEFQCDRRTGALISVEWSGADPSSSPLLFALTTAAEDAMANLETELKAQEEKFALMRRYETAKQLAASATDAASTAAQQAAAEKQRLQQQANDLIAQAKSRCEDAFRQSVFLEEAQKSLLRRGEPTVGGPLEAELERVKRRYVSDRLVEAGLERATHQRDRFIEPISACREQVAKVVHDARVRGRVGEHLAQNLLGIARPARIRIQINEDELGLQVLRKCLRGRFRRGNGAIPISGIEERARVPPREVGVVGVLFTGFRRESRRRCKILCGVERDDALQLQLTIVRALRQRQRVRFSRRTGLPILLEVPRQRFGEAWQVFDDFLERRDGAFQVARCCVGRREHLPHQSTPRVLGGHAAQYLDGFLRLTVSQIHPAKEVQRVGVGADHSSGGALEVQNGVAHVLGRRLGAGVVDTAGVEKPEPRIRLDVLLVDGQRLLGELFGFESVRWVAP